MFLMVVFFMETVKWIWTFTLHDYKWNLYSLAYMHCFDV